MSCVIEDIRNEFAHQINEPQGGDRYIGAFNMAMAMVLEDEKSQTAKVLEKTVCERSDLTPAHLIILTHRVIQKQILGGVDGDNYPEGFEDPTKWREEIESIMTNCQFSVERDLLNKEVTTTIFQRYAGLKFVLNWMKDKVGVNKLSVLDEGCGGDHGLPGIKLDKKFIAIEDKTTAQLFTKVLGNRVEFDKQDALDLRNPRDEEQIAWRRACSFYPQEIKEKRSDFIKFEEDIYQKDGSTFHLGDMRATGLPDKSYDVVSIMTSLYQMNEADISKVIAEAKRMIKPSGLLVIQDIAEVSQDSNKLKFIENGFGIPYTYRTLICGEMTGGCFWEILKWKNGRCTDVMAGKDFDKLGVI